MPPPAAPLAARVVTPALQLPAVRALLPVVRARRAHGSSGARSRQAAAPRLLHPAAGGATLHLPIAPHSSRATSHCTGAACAAQRRRRPGPRLLPATLLPSYSQHALEQLTALLPHTHPQLRSAEVLPPSTSASAPKCRPVTCVRSDEAYEGQIFTAAPETAAPVLAPPAAVHTRVAALPHMRARTVTLGTSSKLFSLTGWRVCCRCCSIRAQYIFIEMCLFR